MFSNISFSMVGKKTTLSSIKEGFVYRVSKKESTESDDLVELWLDANNIEHLNHFWIITSVGDIIKYFVISSQFFKSLFIEEIGSILEFHNTNCSLCPHLIAHKKKNKEFKNLANKFNPNGYKIDRKNYSF